MVTSLLCVVQIEGIHLVSYFYTTRVSRLAIGKPRVNPLIWRNGIGKPWENPLIWSNGILLRQTEDFTCDILQRSTKSWFRP
jgi:hypothetical protein